MRLLKLVDELFQAHLFVASRFGVFFLSSGNRFYHQDSNPGPFDGLSVHYLSIFTARLHVRVR